MVNLVKLNILQSAVIVFMCLIPATVYSNDVATVETLISNGEFDKALAVTDELLLEDKYNVNFSFLKGLILTRQNKLEEASKIFQDLTENHPELPEPYNNLAVVYAAMGDFTNARNALEKAIKTHPSYATAHENMGDIYAKMASSAYNNALELDTNNETAREKLSLIGGLFSIKGNDHVAEISQRRQEIRQTEEKLSQLSKRHEDLSQKNQQQERRAIELQAELDTLELKTKNALSQSQQEQQQTLEQIRRAEKRLQETSEQIAELESQKEAVEREIQLASSRAEIITQQKINQEDIIKAVQAWAGYWSAQDVSSYIASYSIDFLPIGGLSRTQWVAQRENRIQKPAYIKVRVEGVEVTPMGDEHAQVRFTQSYESDTFSDRVIKTLLMKFENNKWLIVEEKS